MTFNITLILTILSSLIGLPALFAFLIDVLKWAGVVTDSTSGKWSAAFNALALIVVAVIVTFFPQFNIPNADATLVDIVKFASLIFAYITQIFVSNQVHALVLRRVTAFSFSKRAFFKS